jgi:sugar/nucleoside kinase (ribokinase family)
MSIAHPNGTPGRWDLDVQRSAPLTVDEVVNAVVTVEELPKSLFIGPTPLNEEAMQFHSLVANLSPQRALMAHPSFLHHPQMFGDIGRLYGFVQMNYAEACVLDVTTRELEELSCRVRFLLGESVDFAITNGPDRGLLWAEHDWYEILPCEVHNIVCDIGAGDVWGAAFMLARWYFGANPKEALSYANLAAAACISGRSIPRF